jgi:hypothetical protein
MLTVDKDLTRIYIYLYRTINFSCFLIFGTDIIILKAASHYHQGNMAQKKKKKG